MSSCVSLQGCRLIWWLCCVITVFLCSTGCLSVLKAHTSCCELGAWAPYFLGKFRPRSARGLPEVSCDAWRNWVWPWRLAFLVLVSLIRCCEPTRPIAFLCIFKKLAKTSRNPSVGNHYTYAYFSWEPRTTLRNSLPKH